MIDMTFEQLLGLRSSMAKGLDDDRLYFLLTRNDQLDTQRLSIMQVGAGRWNCREPSA